MSRRKTLLDVFNFIVKYVILCSITYYSAFSVHKYGFINQIYYKIYTPYYECPAFNLHF